VCSAIPFNNKEILSSLDLAGAAKQKVMRSIRPARGQSLTLGENEEQKSQQHFFISCKKLRIETNTCFYGCFYLGPFDPGQSLTIANALRRTLLSELKGIAITSVEIEGAFHEYSILPGIQDSVLDILLNLKEVVLKKKSIGFSEKNLPINIFKTQVGYLRARGPGIIKAADLKLPPFLQCINPEQYIATLSDDGSLNLKFLINEGKNYHLQTPTKNLNSTTSSSISYSNPLLIDAVFMPVLKVSYIIESNEQANDFLGVNIQGPGNARPSLASPNDRGPYINNSPSSIRSSEVIKTESPLAFTTKTKGSQFNVFATQGKVNTRVNLPLVKTKTSLVKLTRNLKGLDPNTQQNLSLFHPVIKAFRRSLRFTKQQSGFFVQTKTQKKKNELTKPINCPPSSNLPLRYKHPLASTVGPLQGVYRGDRGIKPPIKKVTLTRFNKGLFSRTQQDLNFWIPKECVPIKIKEQSKRGFKIDNVKTAQSKIDLKHNLILEIWTNGSLHPRDALYQSIKNLLSVFSKLKQIKFLGSIYKSEKNYKKFLELFVKKWKNQVTITT
jgi:DNA-directed RNA polymerase alpha subunit